MNIKTITHHPLCIPLLLAFVLRLLFIIISHHIYYPDEIYQSLEQAHRLVQGTGLRPWDIQYGLRSFVFPLFFTLPLKLAALAHLSTPEIYRFFPQIFLIILSLSIPAAGYFIVKTYTTKNHAAEFTALALASWYELIYLAGRALTESVSVDCFALAAIFLVQKKPKTFWVAFFLTTGFFFRPQFFPAAIALGIALIRQKGFLKPAILGTALVTLLFGVVDLLFTGSFLSHIYRNLTLSFGSGISALFGDQPWFFYLATLTISSAGLWITSAFIPRQSKATMLQYVLAAIVVIHSLIPHKEYRFITITTPLWIMLLAVFLYHRFLRISAKKCVACWHYAIAGFWFISLCGMLHALPKEQMVYGQPPLFTDPIFAVYNKLATRKIQCGIFDTSRNWVYTPGYYGFNQNIPLYSADYPPPSPENADYYIIPRPSAVPTGFSEVMVSEPYQVFVRGQQVSLPGYMVLKTNRPCRRDPNYSFNRSFPAVESVLQSIHAKPVIF